MFADYEFYKKEFGGTKVKDEAQYKYLGQQASRYIEKYTKSIDTDTKFCECALVEYLESSNKQGNIVSESISGAYSVNYGANDKTTRLSEINSILELYLGEKYSSVGIVTVIN